MKFLDNIAHVDADQIVDIDGMVQNADDFLAKDGYALRGQDSVRTQIIIDADICGARSFYFPWVSPLEDI